MNQVRIHGDPFGEDAAAGLLRSFLRLALGNGMECALSLSSVQPRPVAAGEHTIHLTDGVRDFVVGSLLPPAEIDLLLRAAGNVVAATAPVVVFAAAPLRADVTTLVALEWPRAAIVLAARDGSTGQDLLERVRAELRWAGCEHPPHALEARELAPWLALPALAPHGPIVHVGCGDVPSGTDLVVDVWLREHAPHGRGLRLVLPDAGDDLVARLRDRVAPAPAPCELVRAAFEPGHARDAAAILLPWRRERPSRWLVTALASGRPVCVSRCAETVVMLSADGICLPIGGRVAAAGAQVTFEPAPAAVAAALRSALADSAAAAATGRRARRHVVEELVRGRPAAPPAPVPAAPPSRPTIVLEAPFFEVSSSSELSIETARALVRRADVDVRLVPRAPFHGDLAQLRRRAPELEPLLCRHPGTVDLWLSAGWPVRAARPQCRTWALRVDWEFGALPWELLPHTTTTADAVVVHSEYGADLVAAAGRDRASIVLAPHGVDAAMREDAAPDPELVAWKGARPAVLFHGGLVWRKGFDVFLRAVLAAREAGQDPVVVVKSVGHGHCYGRFHLGELARRFQRTAGTPPMWWIEDDLPRERLAAIYTACDVLLHPYRGEGFGLPLLEARACGLPVVATAGGGGDALLQGPGAARIPAERRPVELPGAHVQEPWVLEPSAADAGLLLVDALVHRAERRRAARAAAAGVRQAFTWDAAAARIAQLACEPRSLRAQPPLPTVTLAPTPRPEPVGAR
ncbi:MAG: glycosyltransferase [Planctomycetes bacterium]|nr:glycosyltransferase [Planctomycetota bacterium]